MAVIEQLLYGYHAESGQPGRTLLARSPGVSQECAAEIIRYCEAWGGIPVGHSFRPALLSFPLQGGIPSLPGRLFAVIRIAAASEDGRGAEKLSVGQLLELESAGVPSDDSPVVAPIPLFHAVVLSESDFAAFGENPYALALENIFLDRWAPGLILDRREVHPASLAPLVSPLPTESDVDLIGEALRQYFAKGKLILPLTASDEQSDRFLALLVAALPLRLKRGLRFASFAVSDANSYTLAAIYREGQSFRGWQRLLMAHLPGTMNQEAERYLAAVKQTLARSDLLGLEKLSRQNLGEIRLQAEKPAASSPGVLAATITSRAAPAPAPTPWAAATSVARTPNVGRGRPGSKPAARTGSHRRPARRRPARLPAGRRPSFAFLIAMVLVLLLAGAAYLLGTHGGKWFAARPAEEEETAGASLLGVIDVGALYEAELNGFLDAQLGQGGKASSKGAAKALSALRIGAAEDLGQQARLFVDLAHEGIQLPARPEREKERLQALAQRGAVIEHEMQRLLLAYYAFDSGILWRDLGDLEERRLQARYDSLARRQGEALARISQEMALTDVMPALHAASMEATGMSQLVTQFSRKERDRSWVETTEKAAQSLSGHRLAPGTAAYRTSAFLMIRLKRAEDSAGFGRLAFARDYEQQIWLPATVREILPAMRSHAARFGKEGVPPLFTATVAFYDDLERVPQVLAAGSSAEMYGLIRKLADSRALAFDPATYQDHVDRLRTAAVAVLHGRGTNPHDLPSNLFPAGDRETTLAFLQLCRSGAAAEEWGEVANLTSVPFFARWAAAEAQAARQARVRLQGNFDEVYRDLGRAASSLAGLAAAGQDWTGSYLSLRKDVIRALATYRTQLAGDSGRSAQLARLEALAARLDSPLPLVLKAVTVRLGAGALTEPTQVILELLAEDGRSLLRTPAFAVGPSAPAGTGWVGTQDLDLQIQVRAGERLRAVLQRADDQSALLVTTYEAEGEAAVPGALTRPCCGSASEPGTDPAEVPGSVAFRLDEATWRQLQIPLPITE